MILKLLNEAEGNLLDNDNLILTLQNSKIEAAQIEEKLLKQEHDRELFNKIRNFYKEVAKRVANLYFVVLDLAGVEPTYQWSLEFYINLFERAIEKATPGKEGRCRNIIAKFMQLLYESICRSLLEKDKLIFSLTMTIRILLSEARITSNEVRFMMVGGTWTDADRPHPGEEWLAKKTWSALCELSQALPVFAGFADSFIANLIAWSKIYNSSSPEQEELPGQWASLNHFQKVLLLRIIRPDKFTSSA
jgi:dynein heavy chain